MEGRAVFLKLAKLGVVLTLCAQLSACTWLECAVLCEGYFVVSLTNPGTGQHVTCGNFVQKGDLSDVQRVEMDSCIAGYEAKGFVRDRSSVSPKKDIVATP